MSSNHTFGPWSVEKLDGDIYDGKQFWITSGHLRIADVLIQNDETESNANLMAAAPVLGSACSMALDILLADGYGETSRPVVALRRALLKAKGE